jgi:UDP-N-acetylglucosamine acyltransferase
MHKMLYRQGLTLAVAQTEIAQLMAQSPDSAADVQLMLDFLAQSDRGIVR